MHVDDVKLSMIKKFLSEGAEPITGSEFAEFWGSLTDEEKADAKRVVAESLTD